MRAKLIFLSCLTSLMLFVFASATVEAQAWLEDRKRAEGHGIRLGDFELHPGLGTEVGYDTNLFLAEDDDAQDSVLLRVTPHLYLSTLGEERRGENVTPPPIIFRVGGASSFYHYFASNDLDDFSVGADLNLTINPDRPIAFQVTEGFTRSIRPFSEPVSGSGFDFARNQNDLGGRLMFATKSGLFKAGLGFNWGVDWFEESLIHDKDSFTYSPSLNTSWQFLPMTALLYDVRLDFQNYLNEPAADTEDTSTLVTDNARVTSRIGTNGVLTSTISITILLGYSAGFYDEYEDFDDIIGQIEARWKASHSFTLKVGYDRSFESAFQGNFCRTDRGYIDALLLMGGVFLLDAKVWAGLLQYGVPRNSLGDVFSGPDADTEARQDVRISASLSGEYRFIDWLAVTASVGYLMDITDYEVDYGDRYPLPVEPADFNRFEGWLGIRAFY
ncbi:MAG: outer membrane beta-barrel protein [Deltaproteobacteria bacterium]|nr:outer membrane beta-barrel protein [Deltaproteobacteria bacterium]